jgi:hypothetical protein
MWLIEGAYSELPYNASWKQKSRFSRRGKNPVAEKRRAEKQAKLFCWTNPL